MFKTILKAFGVFVGTAFLGCIFGSANILISEHLRLGWGGFFFIFAIIPIGITIGFILIKKFLHYHGSVLLSIMGSIPGLGISFLFLGRFWHQVFIGLGSLASDYVEFAVHAITAALLGTLGFLLGKLIPYLPSSSKEIKKDNHLKHDNSS